MKVLFLPEVENYLFELTEILYQKEYFGFIGLEIRRYMALIPFLLNKFVRLFQMFQSKTSLTLFTA